MNRPEVEAVLCDDASMVPHGQSIHLVVRGEPVSQPRTRGRLLGRKIVLYDPSSKLKRLLKTAINDSLAAIGVASLPVFSPNINVKVEAKFHVTNFRKDLDNMLKLILDVLQGYAYNNDACVTAISAQKIRAVAKNEQYVEVIVRKDI